MPGRGRLGASPRIHCVVRAQVDAREGRRSPGDEAVPCARRDKAQHRTDRHAHRVDVKLGGEECGVDNREVEWGPRGEGDGATRRRRDDDG